MLSARSWFLQNTAKKAQHSPWLKARWGTGYSLVKSGTETEAPSAHAAKDIKKLI